MQFLTNTNFDFIGKRRIAATVSGLLILAGLVSLAIHGGPKLSIDFKGGQIAEVHVTPAINTVQARTALENAGIKVDQVQSFGSPEELLVYMADESDQLVEAAHETVQGALAAAYPDRTVELRREERVGPKIGNELREAAIDAILVSLVLIIAYISLRFVFQFGVAAVAALVHDVLITLGIFSLLGKEMSLVVLAAFLTIIGYSLNDTIVVFDRIRENMGMRRKESYESVVNKSINETLSRTIITSLTTMFTAFILWAAGGAVIHDFAFALVMGVLVGTYSSIFVASPILIAWYHWRASGSKRIKSARA
jgi:preprotein translocase subunit SecF